MSNPSKKMYPNSDSSQKKKNGKENWNLILISKIYYLEHREFSFVLDKTKLK